MTYKGDPIAEKLDKVAEATGFPQMSRKFERALPMRFRVIPLMLLAFAVGGLWVQIALSDIVGYFIIFIVWTTSFAIQQLSALRQPRGRLDEREAALVQSGHFHGLIAAMAVAVLGCIAMGIGNAAELVRLGSFWAPAFPTDWFALAFFLLAIESNVAVMAASSRLPEDELDDEDE